MTRLLVSGTDTGIGKTVFAAALAGALNARYWKPVQSGLEGPTDSEAVAELSGLPSANILQEAYRLSLPASPHLAARQEGLIIDPSRLVPPVCDGSLVIEGAGGLLVPLNSSLLFADVFAEWHLPMILCARTALGTINHTLLSIEAARRRNIPLLGVAFIGPENTDTQTTIATFGKVPVLGRLPWLELLTGETLRRSFQDSFDVGSFTGGYF
ncbi:dethiobiotin synthase [Rhizobium sp. BK456]|uniref:dethiobiotin synthase n=1 Tax=Rhizobium sp. BK456 TaxID=2587007 RepID=UPI00161ACA90|nr:dethiobiotin synthase [Rhizobium sp. BK456]MBB3526955.1 dethiobiotin synthetase [Rhizobium sp. BK456]